jgi:UDP-N-acetylglucosamine--N-acetylmuramyl-(pentapeptide) pyrophosphoryl-undecaprenol N-acetylglucosamine transferase
MAARYAEADLVICRAGALTVAELAAAGVASVLVPFPHAVDDHQTATRASSPRRGAALLMPQSELTPEKLAALLRELTRERCGDGACGARAGRSPTPRAPGRR